MLRLICLYPGHYFLCGGAAKTLVKLVLAQACLSLCYFYMCKIPKSHKLAHFLLELILLILIKLQGHPEVDGGHMSCDMRFPTIWFVRLPKAQISLRICAV